LSPTQSFPLAETTLIGREQERVKIHLSHPQVSRLHAQVSLQHGTATVTDLNSANGTFLNGRRVTAPTVLKRGDRIDVGPYALFFDGTSLSPQSRADNVELVGRNISRTVKDQTTGQPLKLLDGISLVIRPKELVCLLGPSGSGKSTLLSALSARVPADEGTVTISGEDFYKSFDALKHDVAVVPQKDVLHELLSVEDALSYTAKLRLPPDTSSAERDACIAEMLETVRLTDRRGTKIRRLSGGQIKRASLANEIISKPSLLFLDEVTSGLDEQTDREMMKLFRQIADSGKTVVCITHSLANVDRYCDLVVVLTVGGKLAFLGSPQEALQYFRIERLGDVYDCLAQKPAEEWRDTFLGHPLYHKYVASRLPAEGQSARPPAPREPPTLGEKSRTFLRQWGLLAARYLRLQLANRQALAMMFGQCLLVAALLVILFGNIEKKETVVRAQSASTLLFLMAVSCLWFGCNNAAKELVKERTIYTRERDVNLLVPAYYASKLLLLGIWSLLQVTVLFGIVKLGTHLPGGYVGQWWVLSSLALVGVTMGLVISAISKSDDMAVTVVPIVLIPQIALAGVVAPVEGFGKFLSQVFITSYWGYRNLATLLPQNLTEVLKSNDWSTAGAYTMILLHLLVFAGAALAVLLYGEAGLRGTPGKALDRWLALARDKAAQTIRAMER
jgi:ABC-type multidrug transport system ATPase subunit